MGGLQTSQRIDAVGAVLSYQWMAVWLHEAACFPLKGIWPFTPVSKMVTVESKLIKNFTSQEFIHHSKILRVLLCELEWLASLVL